MGREKAWQRRWRSRLTRFPQKREGEAGPSAAAGARGGDTIAQAAGASPREVTVRSKTSSRTGQRHPKPPKELHLVAGEWRTFFLAGAPRQRAACAGSRRPHCPPEIPPSINRRPATAPLTPEIHFSPPPHLRHNPHLGASRSSAGKEPVQARFALCITPPQQHDWQAGLQFLSLPPKQWPGRSLACRIKRPGRSLAPLPCGPSCPLFSRLSSQQAFHLRVNCGDGAFFHEPRPPPTGERACKHKHVHRYG